MRVLGVGTQLQLLFCPKALASPAGQSGMASSCQLWGQEELWDAQGGRGSREAPVGCAAH